MRRGVSLRQANRGTRAGLTCSDALHHPINPRRWDSEFLLEGIGKIKNTRGYDGAGIATMAPDTSGMVSSIDYD